MKLTMAVAFLTALSLQAKSPFELKESSTTAVELLENGKPVFAYNYGMTLANGAPENKRRSSYVHPVYAPNGAIVTDDFPKDHWHHRGIFWSWPIVRVDGKQYDHWMKMEARTRFERWIEKTTDKSAIIAAENGWYIEDRKIMKETVRITAHPTKGNSRELDFELTFEAVGAPLELSGAPDAGKGYGGFSVRFAPREKTVLTTDAGIEPKDTDMIPHPWAQLEAVYGGKKAALRIDVDPKNPGAPNGWCLRNYGFLGVNFPGRQAVQLVPGRPISMKYRVTVTGK